MGKGTGKGDGKGDGEFGEIARDGGEALQGAALCICVMAVLGPVLAVTGLYYMGDGAVGTDERARDLGLYNMEAKSWTSTGRKAFLANFDGASVVGTPPGSAASTTKLAKKVADGSSPWQQTTIADIGTNDYDFDSDKAADHKAVEPLWFLAKVALPRTTGVTVALKVTKGGATVVETSATEQGAQWQETKTSLEMQCFADTPANCPPVPLCQYSGNTRSNANGEMTSGSCGSRPPPPSRSSNSRSSSTSTKTCCTTGTVNAGKPTYSCLSTSGNCKTQPQCITCVSACAKLNGVCQGDVTKCATCLVTWNLASASLLVKPADGSASLATQGAFAGPGFRPAATLGLDTTANTKIFEWKTTKDVAGTMNVDVTIRSEADPFVKAFALTKGSLRFGMSAGDKIKLGGILLTIGVAMMCITYGSCYCIYKTCGSKNKDKGSKQEQAPIQQQQQQQQQQQPQQQMQMQQMQTQPQMMQAQPSKRKLRLRDVLWFLLHC